MPRSRRHAHAESGHRISDQDRVTAVLRLLRGESAENISANLGISKDRLFTWEKRFIRGGTHAIKRHRSWWGRSRKKLLHWFALLSLMCAAIYFLSRFIDHEPPPDTLQGAVSTKSAVSL